MSLRPDSIGAVPATTAQVAQAAFPQGNLYLRIRAEVGTIYNDELFADLFSHTGQPAEAPWRLAVVCAAILGGSCLFGRRLKRCAHASTGNFCSD